MKLYCSLEFVLCAIGALVRVYLERFCGRIANEADFKFLDLLAPDERYLSQKIKAYDFLNVTRHAERALGDDSNHSESPL